VAAFILYSSILVS